MLVSNISLIGWLHSLSCMLALVLGAWNIAMAKGTLRHRRVGLAYVITMLVANLSAFGLYHFDVARFAPFSAGAGVFGLFHWEAVATLAFLGLAVFAAPRQNRAVWAYSHPLAMLVTYYMLVGGLINELFVRVLPLRAFAQAHGGVGFGRSPVIGMIHTAALAWFLLSLIYFALKVARHRRGARHSTLAAA